MSENIGVLSNAWRTETIRLTAFPATGTRVANVAPEVEAWWLTLFGVPHERSTQDLKNGVIQLQGMVDDAFMFLTENPVSLNLRRLAGNPEEPPPGPDSLLPFADVAPAFDVLAQRWLKLDNCPHLLRLAFGTTLLKPIADRKTGYAILDEHLSKVTVDPDSSDFLYQINRRRSSSVIDDLELNRLSRWSTKRIRHFVLDTEGNPLTGPEMLACCLELDINSVPSAQPLPHDDLPRLFQELLELADEIAHTGDIP